MELPSYLQSAVDTLGESVPGFFGGFDCTLHWVAISPWDSEPCQKGSCRTGLDNKLLRNSNANISPREIYCKLVYYIVMVFVLMVVLEILDVQYVLDPIKNMVNEFVGFIPNIIAAGILDLQGTFSHKLRRKL